MVRLPPKKSGKKKVLPIDFSSAEAARASAADLDYDGWIAEAEQQEQQGTRYQHGQKAARHFQNSLIAFQIATILSPDSFDPIYNTGRILYTLAIDHLPAPECVEAIQRAIEKFRLAAEKANEDEEKIDAGFNLGQALVSLAEMEDEKALLGAGTGLEELQQAKIVFQQVETIQRKGVDQIFTKSSETVGMPESEMINGETSNSIAGADEPTASRIVTPEMLIDTILQEIQVEINLFESTNSLSATDESLIMATVESALNGLTRASELRQLLPPSPPLLEADLELKLAHLSILQTMTSIIQTDAYSEFHRTPDQIIAIYEQLAVGYSNTASILSGYADYLVEIATVSPEPSIVLQRAESLYIKVEEMLTNRLSPQKDIPAFCIPSLTAANKTSRANLNLLAYTLDPNHSNSPLFQAQSLALDAINLLAPTFTVSYTGGTLSLTLKKVSSSNEIRKDWRTIKNLREAFWSLVRIILIGGGNLGTQVTQTWEHLSDRLGAGLADSRWWLEEIRGDQIWEASQGKEEKVWLQILSR